MIQAVQLQRGSDIAQFTVQFGGVVLLTNSLGERVSLGLAEAIERIHTLIQAGWQVRSSD